MQTVISIFSQDIEKKYPGFIHSKLLQGIRLSFRLQETVNADKAKKSNGSRIIVRGLRRRTENEPPSALNGFLYSILKSTKAQRRGILTSLLKQFDDTAVKDGMKNWFKIYLKYLYLFCRKLRYP